MMPLRNESKVYPQDNTFKNKSLSLRYHAIRLLSCPVPFLKNEFPVLGGRTIIEVVIIIMIYGLAALLVEELNGKGFEASGAFADIFSAAAVLLGLRNNILEVLFGISFERALFWHKAVSILAVMLTIFHSICGRSVSGFFLIIGMGVMSLSYYIRHTHFELFYFIHTIATASFILFGLIHFSAKFFSFSCMLWLIDLILRYIVTQKKVQAEVTVLPAGIIRLAFPKSFHYEAGQYIFLRIAVLNKVEYHPMSFSSCPEDSTVTVHIRELGDWTGRLGDVARKHYKETPDETLVLDIEVEGPYGKPSIDMASSSYEVYILISGGIGITPMQSIYNGLIRQVEAGRKLRKVLFIWSVRDRALIDSMEPDIHSLKQLKAGEGGSEVTPKSFQPGMDPNPPLFIANTSEPIMDMVDIEDGPKQHSSTEMDNLTPPTPLASGAGRSQAQGEALDSDVIFRNMFFLTQVRPVEDFNKAGIAPAEQPWLHFGRPDLAAIFQQTADMLLKEQNAGGGGGGGRPRVAVGVCGPQPMIDDVRNLCCQSQLSCSGVVFDCHSEIFDF